MGFPAPESLPRRPTSGLNHDYHFFSVIVATYERPEHIAKLSRFAGRLDSPAERSSDLVDDGQVATVEIVGSVRDVELRLFGEKEGPAAARIAGR